MSSNITDNTDNADNTNSTGGGARFCVLLNIVLITLKLLKVIDLPWVWVLSPLWISAIVIIILMIYILTI